MSATEWFNLQEQLKELIERYGIENVKEMLDFLVLVR